MAFYVRMHDTFMSGWGYAKGKKNIFVVECDTAEEAVTIYHAAQDRDELKDITIVKEKPCNEENVHYTYKHFDNLHGA